MSINRICSTCNTTFQLSTLSCPKCSKPLRKLKVRVKKGPRWFTLVTQSLVEAEAFQARAFASPGTSPRKSLKPQAAQAAAQRLRFSTAAAVPAPAEANAAGGEQEVTLLQVFNSFMVWSELHKRSSRDDRGEYDRYLSSLGPLSLSAITPEIIESLLSSMKPSAKFKNRVKPLSPATRKHAATFLGRLFSWALKRGLWTGRNPVSLIELERFDNSRVRYLSQQELHRLLTALDSEPHPAALMVRLLLNTGRRRGEVLVLEWSDVDFERGVLTFRHTKIKRVQSVPVSAQAMEILQQVRSLQLDPVRVFPIKEAKFEKIWIRVRRAAGLQDFHAHDLRHNFCSMAVSSGLSLFTVGQLVGHRDHKSTERYSHLSPEAARRAVDSVAGLFSSRPQPQQPE